MRPKISRFVSIALVATLASVPALHAQKKHAMHAPASVAAALAPKFEAPKIPFEKYVLPNGLEVILSEDHTLPLVAVNVWYHVGAKNEHPGLTGFAHLFEHMMFEGSGHVGPRAHFKYLEAAGASGVNGSTNFDRTNYYETLPSNELALGLWLESDRMGFLLDTLDRTKLANQRDVVRNERRQSREGEPYGLSEEALYHELFPKDHPYYGVIIGSHADIEAARLGDIREFFKTYYAPNNATLTIVGDFQKAEAKALVEKYFGPLKHSTEPKPPVKAITPPITSERRITVTDQVQLPAVQMAWLTPALFSPSDAGLDFASSILGSGKTSRMYQELVYKQQIAQSATCEHSSLELTGIFSCNIIARPGVTAEQIEKAADAVIANFLANGPTDEEITRTRTRTISNMIRPLEEVQDVADMLQNYNQEKGDPGYLPKDIARYEAVTKAAVLADAKKYLTPTGRVVVTTVQGEKKLNDVPRAPADADKDYKVTPEYSPEFMASQAFRKTPPKPGPTPKLHLPVPTTFTLANGLQVYVTERHKLPLFAAALVANAGSSSDSPTLPGVSGFTSAMLTEGTNSFSSTQIANRTADLGAHMGASAGTETASISISALTSTVAPSMDLFADVAQHPAFDPKEVERVRARRKTQLLQSRDEPMAIAQRVGLRALYGADSPYGYTSQGTPESVSAIKADDLSKFYTSHYGPKNAVLVFAGDVTVAQAKSLAEKYFGKWSGTATPPPLQKVEQANAHKIMLVDTPGAPQTAMLVFELAAPRSSPDYAALEILNTPLGGQFSARINMNLREEHGYTYGAFTNFAYRRVPGFFYGGGQMRTDVTGPAAKELMGELEKLHTHPLTPEELKSGKDSVVRSLPAEFETNAGLAGQMAEIWAYKLQLDYFSTLPSKFEAVTEAETTAAANKYIHADQMILITVGDKAKIEPQLKDLGLGPIEEWTVDAEPKK
ncbi:MAG: insulinase family protein [Acidobacteria bacterium]|nr:insulinase family protein [Acidobacteriota bacterium]